MSKHIPNTASRVVARRRIEQRREAVARLALRGLSHREIGPVLAKMIPPIVSASGKPYGQSVIGNDMLALVQRWKENSSETIAKMKARELAVIMEVRRAAFSKKDPDLNVVLGTHDRISKMFGLEAPFKAEITD